MKNAGTARSNAYQLGLYEKAMPDLAWEEKLVAARELGFDCLEISIDETDAKLTRLDDPAAQRAIRDAADASGCPIRTMCLSGHRKFPLGSEDAKTRQRALDILDKALDMSCFLGVRIIQLAGYDVYYTESSPKTRGLFAHGLRLGVEMAARRGVMLGFETMETPFMDTIGKAMRYVDAANSPYLHVYPDLGNITNAACLYGRDVMTDIALGEGCVVAVHLKESKPGHYREVPFGEGHVDFSSTVQAFWRQGVRMFTGEFWHTGNKNWQEDVRRAARFLRGHIEKAAENF